MIRRPFTCGDRTCGGCSLCGYHEPVDQDEIDADLEDQAARQIDAEAS